MTSTSTPDSDYLRHAELRQLVDALQSQHTRSIDYVVKANALRFEGGNLIVPTGEVKLTEDGVTSVDGSYTPTVVGDEGVSGKLGIPLAYVRKLRAEALGLYDDNANHWLRAQPTDRRYLLRLLRAEGQLPAEGLPNGTLRALLSDRYRAIDNLDVVLSALNGVKEAGIDPGSLEITADLTPRRMHVRVTSNEIAANVADIVKDYRVPGLSDRTGVDYPLLFAGFVISNSEVGEGGFSVRPRMVWQVCTNGQTLTREGTRAVHLGGKLMDDGEITWSEKTLQANLNLIKAKTADAVSQFMTVEFLTGIANKMRETTGVKVDDPVKTVNDVSKRLGFTKEQAGDILNAFIDGGQRTAGGVMQAVTWVARHAPDGDTAAEMEGRAFEALAFAAAA
jgi:hypothetical protein